MTNNNTTHESSKMNYTIKGIISAERPCECCGNNRLEKNVVLANQHGELLYVGSDCAGKLLNGRKGKGSSRIVKVATVMEAAYSLPSAKAAENFVWNRLGDMNYVSQVREHFAGAVA